MTTVELNSSPHALYRFLDESGALLYVGITNNPGRRFAQHTAGRPWWHEVATIRMERHPDRESVLAAERHAIQTERPRYNVVHAGTVAEQDTPTSPTTEDVYPVAVDDCVALGLADGADAAGERRDCPVGLVESVSAWGVRLALMSFLSGEFSAGSVTIPWHRIAEIRHARVDEAPSDPFALGYRVVFETEPLGDFQTIWVHGRERMIQERQDRIHERERMIQAKQDRIRRPHG